MKNKLHSEYQYLDLMKNCLNKGVRKVDYGTNVVIYSLFGAQMRFDLSVGFPLLTTKKVYWKGVLHELYWFFTGQTNIKYLVDNNVHIWDDYPYKIYRRMLKQKKVKEDLTKEEFIKRIIKDKNFAKKYGELPRIYGEMWRQWPTKKRGRTVDQLAWVVEELKKDPDAKNLIVNSWNPEYLYTMATQEDTSLFPICHNVFQVSQRDGKLSLQLYHRSADMFLGVPFNIASYALLTIILARVTGYKPGEFIHTFGDYHIYKNHKDQVKEQIKRKPLPFPKVKISSKLKKLEDFTPDKIELVDYNPHTVLKAPLTAAGGYYDPKHGYFTS